MHLSLLLSIPSERPAYNQIRQGTLLKESSPNFQMTTNENPWHIIPENAYRQKSTTAFPRKIAQTLSRGVGSTRPS
jgi:hypothetical protein